MSVSLRAKIQEIRDNLKILEAFVPAGHYARLAEDLTSDKAESNADNYIALLEAIKLMPTTDAMEEDASVAIAHLHYVTGDAQWFILQKDDGEEQLQALGVRVKDGEAILGSVPLSELVKAEHDVQLKFSFTPKPLKDLLASDPSNDAAPIAQAI